MGSAPGRRKLLCLCFVSLAATTSLVASFCAVAQENAAAAPLAETYVINLESDTFPVQPSDRPVLAAVKNRAIYVITVEIRGVTWYRLRMGFFGSKKEAEAILAKYEDQFPDAWIAVADADEIRLARTHPASSAAKSAPPPVAGSTGDGTADLMRQAQDAMLVGDFSRAIRLYTEVLEGPSTPYAQDAQELLGLARERNGESARARTEYETYLRLYPQGEGAARVHQRLMGLITAREADPNPLRAAQNTGGGSGWMGFGSFSQYYRGDQITSGGETTTKSVLMTDLDYMARHRTSAYDIRARFFGQHLHIFSPDDDDQGRVNSFYVEALGGEGRLSGVVGRQTRRDSGILGRFDGAVASTPLSPKTRLNFSAGLPVGAGHESEINSHKHFFGTSFDVLNIAGAFDTNTYYIQQEVDGIIDRQAVGNELRYAQEGRSLFTLVDYDVSYETVNTALALAGWTLPDRTALSVILDYRKTPVLTTSNALMSQPFSTVSAMLDTMKESEIRQLAEDRTGIGRTATVSASKPFSEKYLLMGDVSVTSLTGTPASGGVPQIPDTGVETFYSLQFVANGLLKNGDTTIFGARYADLHTVNTTSLSVNHRRPVNERLYLNPKLRLDFSQGEVIRDRTTVAAAFRVTQQYLRDLFFEGEVQGQWSDQNVNVGSGRTDIYVLYLGFRKTF